MKNTFLLTILVLSGILNSCKKNSDRSGKVVPAPPSNLTATSASTTRINLSWTDNSTNESGFKVERKTGSNAFAVVATLESGITIYSDNGLVPNTTYTYRVYAYNSAGNSLTPTNEATASTNNSGSHEAVTVGSQVWMTKNLDVTTYRNGDPIPQVTDLSQWENLTTGAWCYYENDPVNGAVYGKLYNWYAVNDPRGLAPAGWHVPSEAEWATLETFLGGESVAGGKMKSTTGWDSPNMEATNSSGWTGLPGGKLYPNGPFTTVGYRGYWWSSTEYSTGDAWVHYLFNDDAYLQKNNSGKAYGYSVRCIRD